ncbi:MAG: hypothetical protein ACFCU1_08400 [Sumerlaeia bacterium]
MNSIDRKLLSRLERKGLITSQEKRALEQRFEQCQGTLYQELLPMNIVNERELAKSYARACGLPFLDIRSIDPEYSTVKLLSLEQRQSFQALPIGFAEGKLIVAIWEATDVVQLDRLVRFVDGHEVQVVLTLASALKHNLDRFSLEQLAEKKHGATKPATENKPELQPAQRAEEPKRDQSEETTFSSRRTRFEHTLHQMETLNESEEDSTLHGAETVLENEATKTRRELETRFSLTNSKRLPQSSDEVTKLDSNSSAKSLVTFIQQATLNRGEELEINVSRLQSMVCLRQEGSWIKLSDLKYKEGKMMMEELQELMTVVQTNHQSSIGTIEFTDKGKRHRTIVHHATFPDREHLRILFPANLVLLQRPIRLLGLQPELKELVEPILTGNAKGMLTISCSDEIALRQMVASLGFFASTNNCQVEVVSWLQGLALPKTKDRAALNAEEFAGFISDLATTNPGVLAFAHEIPDTNSFVKFCELETNNAKLGSYLSRDLKSTAEVLESIQTHLQEGHLHLHVWRIPKLCQNCKELVATESESVFPEWLYPLEEHDLHESPGCKECGSRGTKGSVWASQLVQLKSGKLEPVINYKETLRTLIADGLISLDEVLLQFSAQE